MLNHSYSYADCLNNSIKSAWSVDDCFQGRDFDFAKRFLPDRIAGVNELSCLGDEEKRKLNQIRGNSYCHIFAFVEGFIVPMVLDHARGDVSSLSSMATRRGCATFCASPRRRSSTKPCWSVPCARSGMV